VLGKGTAHFCLHNGGWSPRVTGVGDHRSRTKGKWYAGVSPMGANIEKLRCQIDIANAMTWFVWHWQTSHNKVSQVCVTCFIDSIFCLFWHWHGLSSLSHSRAPRFRPIHVMFKLGNSYIIQYLTGSLDIKKTRHIACKQLGRLLEGNHLLIISPQGVFHCSKFFNKRNSSSSSQNDIANKWPQKSMTFACHYSDLGDNLFSNEYVVLQL
jgi:hypothetical protein